MYKNKAVRYAMFGLLYFSQGTVLGYFTALNALYLLSKGVSMTDVGIFALIALIPLLTNNFSKRRWRFCEASADKVEKSAFICVHLRPILTQGGCDHGR